MIWKLKKWWRNYIFQHEPIAEAIWQKVLARVHFLQGLTQPETLQLRQWTTIFLHDKKINGAQDLIVTEEMRVMIAIQACMLILELDLDYYRNWLEIIVYPGEFMLDYEYTDEMGIVHAVHMAASGESWLAGPVILSWEDVNNTNNKQGYNVVIHEFAHKLDMLNGTANGCPPLHRNMDPRAWTAAFEQAFEACCKQLDKGDELVIDPYATTSPAEFFAVMSEAFFVKPYAIQQYFPQVYQQLSAFYRQNPAMRWPTGVNL